MFYAHIDLYIYIYMYIIIYTRLIVSHEKGMGEGGFMDFPGVHARGLSL